MDYQKLFVRVGGSCLIRGIFLKITQASALILLLRLDKDKKGAYLHFNKRQVHHRCKMSMSIYWRWC